MSQTTADAIPTQPVTALTGATAAVYTELCGQQAVTAAALALAAEVSPSSARKALATLEQRGLARRTPGGNDRTRKLADLWYPADNDTTAVPAATPTDTAETAESTRGSEPTAGDVGGSTFPQRDTENGTTTAGADQHSSPDKGDSEVRCEEAGLPRGGESTDLGAAEDGIAQQQYGRGGVADVDPVAAVAASGGTGERVPGTTGTDTGTPPSVNTGSTAIGWTAVGEAPGASDGTPPGSDPAAQDRTADVPAAADAPEEGTSDSTRRDTGAVSDGHSGPTDGAGAGPGAVSSDASVEPADHVCICATCGTQLPSRARKRPAAAVTSGGPRLLPGGLHRLVLDHLRANRDQAWTPTAIAKILGRSSGAIGNALTTMVSRGEALMTSDKPRRYQAAPTAAEDGTNAG
ncbi:hypothetical protein OG455_34620 [Kitasatospora sp. NBC_01287]|uniref:hypothetical protein n=1 Tax=Kitasatospora sp. NBC_01287 TaxID=2903573 RepID=UPI00224F2260|nr:hypothetical protein [Kitasatospora sp. NBC_01287]MCX4750584.1 hypothetical protein [Kitasatospora sp. NBC_01287]